MPTAEEIATLAARLRASDFYGYLAAYVRERATVLETDDVTTAAVAMKRRGQTEELHRLLQPQTLNVIATVALITREQESARTATPEAGPLRRGDWWVTPGEEPTS
jgi:hypothetical protein